MFISAAMRRISLLGRRFAQLDGDVVIEGSGEPIDERCVETSRGRDVGQAGQCEIVDVIRIAEPAPFWTDHATVQGPEVGDANEHGPCIFQRTECTAQHTQDVGFMFEVGKHDDAVELGLIKFPDCCGTCTVLALPTMRAHVFI